MKQNSDLAEFFTCEHRTKYEHPDMEDTAQRISKNQIRKDVHLTPNFEGQTCRVDTLMYLCSNPEPADQLCAVAFE